MKDTLEKIKVEIEKIAGAEFKVEVTSTQKNNNTTKVGIIIRKNDEKIAPILYLDNMNDINDIVEVAQSIWDSYMDVEKIECDMEFLKQWDEVKELIQLHVVNKEMNWETIEECPHRELLDLVSVCYIEVPEKYIDGMGTIKVNHLHLEQWGIDEEELFAQAMKNKKHYLLAGIMEIINAMVFEDISEQTEGLDTKQELYVLTNEEKSFGASVLAFTEELASTCEQLGCDKVMILPSSLHEVLIVPERACVSSVEEVTEMIREINQTQVAAEEVLSDHPYWFCKNSMELQIA